MKIDTDIRYRFYCRRMEQEFLHHWSELTVQCQEAMFLYLLYGLKPGGFLTAILLNDLLAASYSADFENKRRMGSYAQIIHHTFPRESQGSKEAMQSWMWLKQPQREKILLQHKLIPDVFEMLKMTADESS